MTCALVACGAATTADPGASPPLEFANAPPELVGSRSGGLQLTLRWSPAIPVKGNNAAELTIVDATTLASVDGLALSVVPWMPAHGHGTSAQPVVTAGEGPGVFVVTPLYLFMAGEWQLRMTLSGALTDAAIATVEIP